MSCCESHRYGSSSSSCSVPMSQKRSIKRALCAHGMEADWNDMSNSDTDSSSSNQSDSLVPLEVLEKFVKQIRARNWKKAQDVCRIMLLYEPYNVQILKYQFLVKNKIVLEEQLEKQLDKESCFDYDCCNKICPQLLNWACTKKEKRKERDNYKKMKRDHYKSKLLFSDMGDEESYVWKM